MSNHVLGIKKIATIILCIVVLIGVYYLLMIRPFDELWDESKAILSGKLQPDEDNLLRSRYNLNRGEPYSLATDIKLSIKRSFVWRWGNRGKMIVNFTQEYYDNSGNLLRKIQSGEKWILEKIGGKWKIVDIVVPNL